MPTEAVRNRTFKEALKGPVRFEIPFFQRGYAWERRQWDQLFVDLQEQILEEIQIGTPLNQLEHFFGPIVVLEKSGADPDLKEFTVIDGQQRITTIYLLLAIISEHIKAKAHLSSDAHTCVEKLKKYLCNDVEGSDDYRKLKVFSCKGDRLPTYQTVFGLGSNPTTPHLTADLQLYIPGHNKIEIFRAYANKKLSANFADIPSLWQLAEILLECLKIVWIPLDEAKDDPQAIFESLNDKGMQLSASELLCNYLFRPIIAAKENHEDLHNNKWLKTVKLLESDNAFEEYLRNLLSIGENKMVGKHRKVYVHFKSKHHNLSLVAAKEHLNNIADSAKLYKTILNPTANRHRTPSIGALLIHIDNTGMASCRPFLLAVLRAFDAHALTEQEVCSVLNEALTLLVRRKTTEQSTTKYDVMFPNLLGKIVSEPDKIRALQEAFKNEDVWVSDQEFRHALENNSMYRSKDLQFSRMVLIELDKKMQVHGQFPDYTTLHTIEHVLPQTPDDAWKKYLGTDAGDEDLVRLTNSLGNLCLLSGPANSAAGRTPFESKQNGYSPVCALTREIKQHTGTWNLLAIKERSARLAGLGLDTWKWSGT
jgi:hypothetical protein